MRSLHLRKDFLIDCSYKCIKLTLDQLQSLKKQFLILFLSITMRIIAQCKRITQSNKRKKRVEAMCREVNIE